MGYVRVSRVGGRGGDSFLSPELQWEQIGLAARREGLVSIYRLHDTTGDDLGLLEHPAPNLEPGDVVMVADGGEAVVTARVEAEPGWGQLVAMLEVAIARRGSKPTTPSRSFPEDVPRERAPTPSSLATCGSRSGSSKWAG